MTPVIPGRGGTVDRSARTTTTRKATPVTRRTAPVTRTAAPAPAPVTTKRSVTPRIPGRGDFVDRQVSPPPKPVATPNTGNRIPGRDIVDRNLTTTPTYGTSFSPGPGAGLPGAPLSQDETLGTIAGQRAVFRIGNQLYLVWLVPIDLDEDGNFDESIPIAYAADPQELVDAGLFDTLDAIIINEILTLNEWNQMGGLTVGDIVDLDNPDDDPFEFFVEQMVENSILFPWILDPEIMAKTAAAWLEGRELSEAELVGTEWWQSHSDAERAWMVESSQDPLGAADLLNDNRLMVLDMLERAGVNNSPADLVNLMADSFTRGEWSEIYLTNQIEVVADPAKRGKLDIDIENYLVNGIGDPGFVLDTTQGRRQDVKALVDSWLGPVFGAWSDAQIDGWAGRLRQDPDAGGALTELLSGQRLAMFDQYEDPTLRYDDIAGPWRGYWSQVLGETADESNPLFADIVRANNTAEAGILLREHGIATGNKKVQDEMLGDLLGTFGTQVARA